MADHQAMFWNYNENVDAIRCHLCPHHCLIKEGRIGICKTRHSENNQLMVSNYGEVTSIAKDPIEKKPLYHFKPGLDIISLGTFGCNMTCTFCQNYQISQHRAKSRYYEFDDILEILNKTNDNAGLSFTYNEPFMWYEYIYDTAKKIKEIDETISIVIVTNGYINKEPLQKILPYIDALNIDLKSFNKRYYQKICGAKLTPVLETIALASKHCHVEVTTLMVTDENDSLEEIDEIATFLAKIDSSIPLHLSRYYPNYKMVNQATEIEKILKAKEIANKSLDYVYIGNVPNIDQNTYCPNCRQLLIERTNYDTVVNLSSDCCPNCGRKINIII